MRIVHWLGALALGMALTGAAHADDPNDPSMKNPAARERDRAVIRRLNETELARTSQRDAQYAEGWQAWREAPARQAEYERQLAQWRRAVELCRSGRYEYCQR